MSQSIKNVSIREFKGFLSYKGLKYIRTSDGHEVWSGEELTRPVIFQTHIDPIPIFVIKSNLRTMECTLNDLRKYLASKDN
jgi:hypothetical protein